MAPSVRLVNVSVEGSEIITPLLVNVLVKVAFAAIVLKVPSLVTALLKTRWRDRGLAFRPSLVTVALTVVVPPAKVAVALLSSAPPVRIP